MWTTAFFFFFLFFLFLFFFGFVICVIITQKGQEIGALGMWLFLAPGALRLRRQENSATTLPFQRGRWGRCGGRGGTGYLQWLRVGLATCSGPGSSEHCGTSARLRKGRRELATLHSPDCVTISSWKWTKRQMLRAGLSLSMWICDWVCIWTS